MRFMISAYSRLLNFFKGGGGYPLSEKQRGSFLSSNLRVFFLKFVAIPNLRKKKVPSSIY